MWSHLEAANAMASPGLLIPRHDQTLRGDNVQARLSSTSPCLGMPDTHPPLEGHLGIWSTHSSSASERGLKEAQAYLSTILFVAVSGSRSFNHLCTVDPSTSRLADAILLLLICAHQECLSAREPPWQPNCIGVIKIVRLHQRSSR